jgi:hypothetical protein
VVVVGLQRQAPAWKRESRPGHCYAGCRPCRPCCCATTAPQKPQWPPSSSGRCRPFSSRRCVSAKHAARHGRGSRAVWSHSVLRLPLRWPPASDCHLQAVTPLALKKMLPSSFWPLLLLRPQRCGRAPSVRHHPMVEAPVWASPAAAGNRRTAGRRVASASAASLVVGGCLGEQKHLMGCWEGLTRGPNRCFNFQQARRCEKTGDGCG